MTEWTPAIVDCFQSIQPDLESDFTPAAYNKLLNTLFPVDTLFTVFPQVHRHEDSSIPSSRTTFTVYYKNTPVFLLDLHSFATLTRLSVREAADDHIRMHLRDILPYCHLETLHAVSAFGTKLCFYNVAPRNVVLPTRLSLDADGIPIEWWDCDILEHDGAVRLKEILNKIKSECENS